MAKKTSNEDRELRKAVVIAKKLESQLKKEKVEKNKRILAQRVLKDKRILAQRVLDDNRSERILAHQGAQKAIFGLFAAQERQTPRKQIGRAVTSLREDVKLRAKEIKEGIRKEFPTERLKRLASTKLQNRRILKKAKRATVVVNVPVQEKKTIKNFFADTVQQDRRNLFFT